MGFDDFLESKHSYRGNYNKRRYYDDDIYSHESHHSGNSHEHYKWLGILDKIRSNKKLKRFIIIAGILVLVIGIALIIVLLPLIVKLFNYINQNGLQGLFDEISGLLNRLWEGSGK